MEPMLRQIVNLWTLMEHPSREAEWGLERKLQAIKEAGFDGVTWFPDPELCARAAQLGLIFVGAITSSDSTEFPALLDDLRRCGAHHVNVQLGRDDMLTPEALRLTLALMREAKARGLEPAIETHRERRLRRCMRSPTPINGRQESFCRLHGTFPTSLW